TGLKALEERCTAATKELAAADEAVLACAAECSVLQEKSAPFDRAIDTATGEAAAAEKAVRMLAERRRETERQEAAALADLASLQREESAAQEDERRLTMDEQAMTRG